MSTGIYVEVDQADLRRVTSKLEDMEKAPRHLRNAINRTATQAMKMIKAGRAQGYTIKAGRFNKSIKKHPATPSTLTATIVAGGRSPLIKEFKTSYPKAGGKADILKTGWKRLVTSAGAAFIPKAGKAAGRMVSRLDKKSTPVINGVHVLKNIHVLHGPSVQKITEMIWKGERGGQGDMDDRVSKRLHEEILKEISKIT